MATREEILEEIRTLNDAIVGLETDHRSAKSEALKISIDAKITAQTALLTAKEQRLLHLEQQSKFHCTFPLSFPNLLDVILCPNFFRHLLLTHSGSATTQGKRWIDFVWLRLLVIPTNGNYSFLVTPFLIIHPAVDQKVVSFERPEEYKGMCDKEEYFGMQFQWWKILLTSSNVAFYW